MNVKDIMLSAERQTRNDKYCMKSLISGILKKEKKQNKPQKQHGRDDALAGRWQKQGEFGKTTVINIVLYNKIAKRVKPKYFHHKEM